MAKHPILEYFDQRIKCTFKNSEEWNFHILEDLSRSELVKLFDLHQGYILAWAIKEKKKSLESLTTEFKQLSNTERSNWKIDLVKKLAEKYYKQSPSYKTKQAEAKKLKDQEERIKAESFEKERQLFLKQLKDWKKKLKELKLPIKHPIAAKSLGLDKEIGDEVYEFKGVKYCFDEEHAAYIQLAKEVLETFFTKKKIEEEFLIEESDYYLSEKGTKIQTYLLTLSQVKDQEGYCLEEEELLEFNGISAKLLDFIDPRTSFCDG